VNVYVIALALFALVATGFSIGLLITNRDLRERLAIQRSNTKNARAETEYWLFRAGNFERERNAYRYGLDKVIALRTVNMASIGQRMSRSASVAINEGERIKTEAASR